MISYKPLERLLREKGISLAELAKILGIEPSTIYINLSRKSSTEFIEKICKALNCDIQDVIEYSEEEVSLDRIQVDWDELDIKIKESGYNLVSLAEKLGLGRRFLQNNKQLKRKMKLTICEDICKVLNCSLEDIIS